MSIFGYQHIVLYTDAAKVFVAFYFVVVHKILEFSFRPELINQCGNEIIPGSLVTTKPGFSFLPKRR